ncbi:MAG: MBL fold metallo-hydrolase [Planctomycetaceae bacterium]|nr:MBL fold metallo-hydrolase [Planctomycetaceae bacterium]
MKNTELEISMIVSESFGENTYILRKTDSADCILIDPGFDSEQLVGFLKQNRLNPVAIFVTHGHIDHIAGISAVKEEWKNCTIYVSKWDAYKLTDPIGNLSATFGFPLKAPDADILLRDGEKISIAGIEIESHLLPGHSAGHFIYSIHLDEGVVIFSGDTIFMDSIGRHDFPDGNYDALITGIRDKILTLSEEAVLYPGHGPKTTVGRERRYNPFLTGDVC